MDESASIGPVKGTKVPRYAGSRAFAPLPSVDAVLRCDIAILGVPFDGGASFPRGARFGPSSIHQASRRLRPAVHPEPAASPSLVIEAVDAGDVPCSSFDIDEALQQIADAARVAIEREQKFLADAGFGSSVIRAGDFDRLGAAEVVGRARERVGDAPVYLSVDSNVREPACAPGTGTPERGGFTSRELLALLRGMPGEQLVAADVIDVNSAHGHARTTSLAGVSVADETTSRMAGGALSAPGAQA